MAQYKKETIKEAIELSAITLFAKKGYSNTTVNDISKHSGISVGNIYRYYKSKKLIYDALISQSFVTDFKTVLAQKIAQELPDDIFFEFVITNKQRFILLFSDAKGTSFENLAQTLISFMTDLVIKQYFKNADAPMRAMVACVYKNYIETMKWIVQNYEKNKSIILQLNHLNTYHFNGIMALIKKEMQ